MFLSKMKTATVLLLILASGTGVGTLGHRVLAQRPQAAEPPARIADTKPTNAEFQKRKQSRLDLYGDPLPEGTVTRLGTTRIRHEPRVDNSWLVKAISPDSKMLATKDWESIRLWSLEDGKLLREFPINSPSSIAFMPDGKRILTCTDKTMDFYDVATGRKLRSIPYPSGSMAISPDYRMSAWNLKDGDVQVMDLDSGKERVRLRGANVWGMEMRVAADSKSLIFSSWQARRSCRWDLATGKQLST